MSDINIENIYLDAGGIYGYTICGCLQVLQENNILKNINNILGCSVGGLIGLLLALEYTTEEIYSLGYNIDLSKIINLQNNNFFNIVKDYGFDSGEKLSRILKIFIYKKVKNENITFKELYQHNQKNLIIIGNNISTRRHEIFNKDTHPNMEIWKAVRITCGLPLIFQPFIYQDNYYIDGGNSCNTTNYFSDMDKTIGIMLESGDSKYHEINNFEDYITNLFYSPLKSLKFNNFYRYNCIEIDTNQKQISAVDFNIDKNNKKELYNFGYLETKKQLPRILENIIDIGKKKDTTRSIGTQTV